MQAVPPSTVYCLLSTVIPALSLVVLVGPSGCGKSTFARRHFGPFEVLSSDFFRGLVSNDENDQSATRDAFSALHHVAGARLGRGLLTVIDATSVTPASRQALVALARRHHVDAIAIVLDLPVELCVERNRARAERSLDASIVQRQVDQLHESLPGLRAEGFARVVLLRDPAEVDAVALVREPMPNDRRHLRGPFDVIGDVHGCIDELRELLERLGYVVHGAGDDVMVEPPPGRSAVFVGDLVDRGPDTPAVMRLVMSMVAAGSALVVQGNHDAKLVKALRGRNVQLKGGLEDSLEQLGRESAEFRRAIADFLAACGTHVMLDDGGLLVAHAGLPERLHGRESPKVRAFSLFGDTTGELDELGLPVRLDWAASYRGRAAVVYGHTPVADPEWRNNTINIDTGCVFGGRLTALRWPARELVSVPARRAYAVPRRPFLPEHGALAKAKTETPS
ncbi:MAG TPA: AAA family ATPase [Longimicrobiales bacterium]